MFIRPPDHGFSHDPEWMELPQEARARLFDDLLTDANECRTQFLGRMAGVPLARLDPIMRYLEADDAALLHELGDSEGWVLLEEALSNLLPPPFFARDPDEDLLDGGALDSVAQDVEERSLRARNVVSRLRAIAAWMEIRGVFDAEPWRQRFLQHLGFAFGCRDLPVPPSLRLLMDGGTRAELRDLLRIPDPETLQQGWESARAQARDALIAKGVDARMATAFIRARDASFWDAMVADREMAHCEFRKGYEALCGTFGSPACIIDRVLLLEDGRMPELFGA